MPHPTFIWKLVQKRKDGNGISYVYYAIGAFSNAQEGAVDFFAVTGLSGDDSIASAAAKHNGNRSLIMVTAGSSYLELNAQYEVSFTPTSFAVEVDVIGKLINISPMTAATVSQSASPSFDPIGGLALAAINQLNGLSMISTSLYTSVVGDALITNIKAATTNSTSHDSPAYTTRADSLPATLDDIIVFIGSSQFFVPFSGEGDFSTVDVHMIVQAVRLGEVAYVMATFGICAALLVAVIVEALRTRFWKSLPRWNFMDTTSLVISSAVAGTEVRSALCRGQKIGTMEWTGGLTLVEM
ncbi:MAG: hypothetical protein L6R38_003518 [Xanthoria sp. 2 TBL-2021]|nr:MAG: hypothetical protein L6R38_003518 [Xanthoria sp. 2 TBL-2021]